jgi:hypothetical protein
MIGIVIIILSLMIFSSWIYGIFTDLWTPYDKVFVLLALLIGGISIWHPSQITIGETIDAPNKQTNL